VIDLGAGRCVRLGAVLGKGSSATVYRGELQTTNNVRRKVAAKVFSAVSSDESEQVFASLVKTTQRTACVDHPNVVQIFECVDWRGQPCLITELVDGISLGDLQQRYASSNRRMPLDLALFIAAEVAEALAGARVARGLDGYQLGMLHHSLCSREVRLSWRGEVKLGDFEMSTARAASSSIRSLRQLALRATAMAPENAVGGPVDARSDVFAFGVMLYELLIGPRFPANLTNQEAMKLAREGYVQPQTFKPNLPHGALSIIYRCLEVNPELRYPNAVALAYDLRRVILALGVGDGRYFLRRTLEHEFADHADPGTAEVIPPPPQVVELPRRRK
jgi:serine/threonine protein kinase